MHNAKFQFVDNDHFTSEWQFFENGQAEEHRSRPLHVGAVTEEKNMPQYLVLLYADPKPWMKFSPQEKQQGMLRYRAWGQKADQQKFKLGGAKLADEPGRVMRRGKGKVRVSDGPYIETKELLGGYYLIEAASYDQAVERCNDHPHLEHGTIEIRELDARAKEELDRATARAG